MKRHTLNAAPLLIWLVFALLCGLSVIVAVPQDAAAGSAENGLPQLNDEALPDPQQIIIIPNVPSPTPTRTPTPVSITTFVWDDIDQDGRQDPGEPGLSGVSVQLWNTAKT
ncbi:hypothetical protein FBR02_07565, partial [Anaerolineae bacterium CFX9]|nr:hypothetical protein [Anaerolineae bacterium CFX9]